MNPSTKRQLGALQKRTRPPVNRTSTNSDGGQNQDYRELLSPETLKNLLAWEEMKESKRGSDP